MPQNVLISNGNAIHDAEDASQDGFRSAASSGLTEVVAGFRLNPLREMATLKSLSGLRIETPA